MSKSPGGNYGRHVSSQASPKTIASTVGVHQRATRYWELKEDKAPTSTASSFEKIKAVLRDHGVIVIASPTTGAPLGFDIAAERGFDARYVSDDRMEKLFAFKRQCRICQAISIIRRRKMER